MSFLLLVHPLLINIILLMPTVYSAPKIGGILFEPILFEAYESEEKTTNTGKSQTKTTILESTKETTLLDNVTTGSSKKTVNTDTSPSKSTQETTLRDNIVRSINLKEIIELLRSNIKKKESSEELGYFVTLAKSSTLISKLTSTKTVSTPLTLKTTNSKITNSEITNSEITNSEITNSEVTHTKVTDADLTKSEVTKSKITASEMIRSSDSDQITVTLNSTQNTRKLFAFQQKVTKPALRQSNRFREDEGNTTLQNLQTYGYVFDDRICRIVDNRVLCGYNANPQPAKGIQTVNTGNGCRVRGDRIECGYVDPPFSNPRRPPPSPNAGTKADEDREFKYRSLDRKVYKDDPPIIQKLMGSDSSSPTEVLMPTDTFTTDRTIASSITSITTSQSTLVKKLKKQHCVEKDDRIVCYDVKE